MGHLILEKGLKLTITGSYDYLECDVIRKGSKHIDTVYEFGNGRLESILLVSLETFIFIKWNDSFEPIDLCTNRYSETSNVTRVQIELHNVRGYS